MEVIPFGTMPQADFGVTRSAPLEVIPSWDDATGSGGLADLDVSGNTTPFGLITVAPSEAFRRMGVTLAGRGG